MRLDTSANTCFVCGPGNTSGLNIKFRLDEGICRAEWTSTPAYTGYDGVTHGGILFCLLDDVMANALFLQGTVCVTAKAEVRYRQALTIGERVDLEGEIVKRKDPLAVINGSIYRHTDRALIAESVGHFMIKGRT